ncbi:MAG: hypothetical protein E6J08_07335 [Chloroflexi bacterium]|nr:MAG: hypothetical protein E6J08_07335 [Chloroflexota bacterium]
MNRRVIVPFVASLALLTTGCAATQGGLGSEASGARTASDTRTDNPPDASSARIECVMSARTVTAPLVAGGSPVSLQPSSPPAVPLAVMFGKSTVDVRNYTVQLVDSNGLVVARAEARSRSAITGTCGNDVQVYPAMPMFSTSVGRAYFLDGDTDVRYLAPDGSTGLAFRIAGNSQSVAMFQVSPDDRMVAVSVFDYRRHPVASTLSVQDMNRGEPTMLPPSGVAYRWPAGWHGGKLLVGSDTTPNPTFGFYGPLPYRISSLQLLDPSTGSTLATLSSGECKPMSSLPSTAGLACATANLTVGRIDWSGNATIFANGDAFTGGASLSPDGTQLLASGTGALLKLISSPETGSRVTTLGTSYPEAGGYPGDGGWIDENHVVYRRAGTPNQYVVDVRTGVSVALPPATVMADRLPGGF